MMKSFAIVALLAVTCSAAPQLLSLRGDFMQDAVGESTLPKSNVCRMARSYCPNDPGCTTYTMSVKEVGIQAHGYEKPVKAEDLKTGDVVTITVTGVTTITKVPAQGSYRIYSLAGHNAAAGVLTDVMTLNAPDFTITVTFTLTDDCFDKDNKFVEFGLDVFQESSGSDEAFCMEFYDVEYLNAQKAKPSPPFQTLCKDEGNGTFVSVNVPITGTPIPAESCSAPPPPNNTCALEWVLCPRDPGCVTYDASPSSVEVVVQDKDGIKAGDKVTLTVKGTTQLREVPTSGSYRIYSLAGHNMASGALGDVFTISGCVSKGCNFEVNVGFELTSEAFDPTQGWLEFGLDVFRESSGSLESMCVEISNNAYIKHEEDTPSPPFVAYCVDEGWGHFKKQTVSELVSDVKCQLV